MTQAAGPPGEAAAEQEREAFSALDWIAVVLVASMALGLLVAHFAVTPVFGQMYADFAATLPMITRLIISAWFAPLAAVLPLVPLVAALVRGGPLALRRGLVIAAFVCGLLSIGVYAFGLYVPIWQLAADVSE